MNRTHAMGIVTGVLVALSASPVNAQSTLPTIDSAIEGFGDNVTKAYFFAGGYVVRYDWGTDRVAGGPMPKGNLDFAKHFGTVDAGASGFGGTKDRGVAFQGNQYGFFEPKTFALRGTVHEVTSDIPAPFSSPDAAINGLGDYANFVYLYKGNQYIKFDVTEAKVVDGEKPITNQHFDATFATRIDAAVNGAGSFIGYGYFFRGDEYVKFNWASGWPTGIAKKIVPKWPGLLEMVGAARGAEEANVWVTNAITHLDAKDDAMLDALEASFGINSDEITSLVQKVRDRLSKASTTLTDPSAVFRFRTLAEARTDLKVGTAGAVPMFYATVGGQVSFTTPFLDKAASCRSVNVLRGTLEQGGASVSTTDRKPETLVNDSAALADFVTRLNNVTKPCG